MPKRRLENALLPGVAILVLLIDRISKRLVVANLKPGEPWSPIAPLERWASLTYVTNTGVAFGLFPNWGSLFVLVAIAMATVIMVYYCHMP
ncbi:MAG: signal peptidase II, partial [Chloroflexota bacterium]|nr:signal peptidase II [Chloroflexota bacterium]